jgi:predicted MFS family arabinose efflux permease
VLCCCKRRYIIDRGLPPWVGGAAMSLIGVGNVVGTFAAGALAQRYGAHKHRLLSAIYGARAVLFTVMLLAPASTAWLLCFAFILGVLWLSTVPLTSGLVGGAAAGGEAAEAAEEAAATAEDAASVFIVGRALFGSLGLPIFGGGRLLLVRLRSLAGRWCAASALVFVHPPHFSSRSSLVAWFCIVLGGGGGCHVSGLVCWR